MKRIAAVAISLGLAGAACAGSLSEVRKRVEASLLVTGTIDIAADGSVRSYTLDKQDKLPPVVVDLVHKAAATWRFKPVDGSPADVIAKMNLRVVAKPVGDDNFAISISGANFGENTPGEQPSVDRRKQPTYPASAVASRVSGTVYVLVRIDHSGHVADASVEQVNLTVVDTDIQMKKWRKVLGDASLDAARDWTFHIPTTGKHVDDAFWVARVPVSYTINGGAPRSRDGGWTAYVPGPRQMAPWSNQHGDASQDQGAADALPDDSIALVGTGPVLTTPLQPSGS